MLLAERGDKKTYTFPIYRSTAYNIIENLVLKENSDDTYSGFLIQYNLTEDEKKLFISGHDLDIKTKIKIFSIDKLNLNARIQTDVVGCYEITWETGTCTSNMHHEYGDSACELTGDDAAPKPAVLAIKDICGGSNQGPSSDNPTIPGDGSSSGGGYDTTPYTGSEAELIEMNRVFRLKLNPTQLSWYDAHTVLGMDLAKLYNEDNSTPHLTFLKSIIDYMKASTDIQDTFLYASIIDFLKQDSSYQENWALINNILAENNADLGIQILEFIKENPDTLDRAEIINRIKALDNALIQNPNLLLDIPCSQLSYWQDIATHQVPQSVKIKMQNIKNQTSYYDNWLLTDFDDGLGTKLNMDLFPVNITTMPNKPNSTQKYTPAEFFDFFRKNINLFAEQFTPISDSVYGIDDTVLWNSSNPLGALIHIDIDLIPSILSDDGTVVCTGYWTNSWMFTTVKAPLDLAHDGIHPVAGNRLFSYFTNPDGSINIYTRGVDRVSRNYSNNSTILNSLIQGGAFAGADKLWTDMQDKLKNYINTNGGSASKVTPVKYRPDYTKIVNYIKGNATISTLGCH